MRAVAITVVTGACYSANPADGIPCEPGASACPTGQSCIAVERGHECLPIGTPPFVMPDAAPEPPRFTCDKSNPALQICLSFDNAAFVAPIANEGSEPVGADFTNVARIEVPGGGAAQFGVTSSMLIAPTAKLTGYVATDMRLRFDAPVVGRVGLLDGDLSATGMSMFVYESPQQLRCDLGATFLYVDIPVVVGEWVELACTCENNVMKAYRNGVLIGMQPTCAAGDATVAGIQIGQNSRAGTMMPPNEWFVGAIDRVRLWTAVPGY